eukprot:2909028-Rhodomonas_salina.1
MQALMLSGASPMLSVPRNNLNLKRSSLSSVASGTAPPLTRCAFTISSLRDMHSALTMSSPLSSYAPAMRSPLSSYALAMRSRDPHSSPLATHLLSDPTGFRCFSTRSTCAQRRPQVLHTASRTKPTVAVRCRRREPAGGEPILLQQPPRKPPLFCSSLEPRPSGCEKRAQHTLKRGEAPQ